MNVQKSFEARTKGALYVVPTPIGNLEDITYRALNTLKSVNLVAAEDTRNTKKLLNYFEISTPLISYHEHNKLTRDAQLLNKLQLGEDIALVSDAGMPAISDPGSELVQAAIHAEYPVIVLPGANAAICALVGSGISSSEFLFYGFLPRKNKEKQIELKRLKFLKATLIFYESPYRVKETLLTMKEQLGDQRQVAIVRELTKRFEEYVRGSMDEVINWAIESELKGEFCIVVEGNHDDNEQAEEEIWWSNLSIQEHVIHYMDHENMTNKEAVKRVALERNMPKREVYHIYHVRE